MVCIGCSKGVLSELLAFCSIHEKKEQRLEVQLHLERITVDYSPLLFVVRVLKRAREIPNDVLHPVTREVSDWLLVRLRLERSRVDGFPLIPA